MGVKEVRSGGNHKSLCSNTHKQANKQANKVQTRCRQGANKVQTRCRQGANKVQTGCRQDKFRQHKFRQVQTRQDKARQGGGDPSCTHPSSTHIRGVCSTSSAASPALLLNKSACSTSTSKNVSSAGSYTSSKSLKEKWDRSGRVAGGTSEAARHSWLK